MAKPGIYYSEAYKNRLFGHWFKNGKLGYTTFFHLTFPDENGRLPSQSMVKRWIENEFKERGEHLDQMVMDELNAHLVHEKVEMLKRHADTAKEMQTLAIDYLKQLDIEDFTSSALIRLWSEGVRVERESLGIPQALEKMSGLTDEALVKEIEEIVRSSPATIEMLEDGDNG